MAKRTTALCKRCKKRKPFKDFLHSKEQRSSYSRCKACCNKRSLEHYEANKEAAAAAQKAWRAANSERYKKGQAKWRAENPERIREYRRMDRTKAEGHAKTIKDNFMGYWGPNDVEFSKDGGKSMMLFLDDEGTFVIIDTDKYNMIKHLKWTTLKPGNTKMVYAAARVKSHYIMMHRVLLGLEKADERIVDHINLDSLDCRMENMRICTRGQNCRNVGMRKTNSSGFKGVSWNKTANKWQATITYRYKRMHIGVYMTKEAAARAYDREALRLHGEFARTNKQMGLL